MFAFGIHISRYRIVEKWRILEWIVSGSALLKNDCSWNEGYRLLHCWTMIAWGVYITGHGVAEELYFFGQNLMNWSLGYWHKTKMPIRNTIAVFWVPVFYSVGKESFGTRGDHVRPG